MQAVDTDKPQPKASAPKIDFARPANHLERDLTERKSFAKPSANQPDVKKPDVKKPDLKATSETIDAASQPSKAFDAGDTVVKDKASEVPEKAPAKATAVPPKC